MFGTKAFEDQLINNITVSMKTAEVTGDLDAIMKFLRRLAIANEEELMTRELEKIKPRGVADALLSARSLIKDSAQFAKQEGRSRIRLNDVKRAYQAKFCQFWPFCK